MTKLDSLRRVLLPCFTTTTTKNHLTTSPPHQNHHPSPSPSHTPPRPSKAMVICTLFGHRHGHVWFAVQDNHLNPTPTILLQLSIPTYTLLQQLNSGLVRLALECHTPPDSDLRSCPLRSIPMWTLYCNGRKVGFAVGKKATEPVRVMLKSVQSSTVGAGVIPSFGFGVDSGVDQGEGGELIYMRGYYEWIVGGPDSESFHLVNLDGCLGQGQGQDLSIFLMRTRGPFF
ncbi:putative protein MIZU-KUSSEI 1-like, plant [Helianthus anomalus]